MTIFLKAQWKYLAMVNYEIDPVVLLPYVPKGTELDLWNGKAFVSLVGFMFLDTLVKGIPIPFHRDFEEVNLRFYLKRATPEGERRGVAFIKEIVPRWAIAQVANFVYHENYVALPMSHTIERHESRTVAEYRWKFNNRWEHIGVSCEGVPEIPEHGSEAQFITEHYWGYSMQSNKGTMEYEVKHTPWRIWKSTQCHVNVDVERLYGPAFAPFLEKDCSSSFLAEGSEVLVMKGKKIVA